MWTAKPAGRPPATLRAPHSIAGGSAEAMAVEQRFMTLADVAEVLNISVSQVYALVRSEQLRAIKIGGRGQWRGRGGPARGVNNPAVPPTSDLLPRQPH